MATNLRRLRRIKGLTQEELARIVGTTRPKISDLERGKLLYPRPPFLVRLAAALGVTLDQLLGENS